VRSARYRCRGFPSEMSQKSPSRLAQRPVNRTCKRCMHAVSPGRRNPPIRQSCRPRGLYPNVTHALCDDLHRIPRAVGQPHVTVIGQCALDRSGYHPRIMRRAKSRRAAIWARPPLYRHQAGEKMRVDLWRDSPARAIGTHKEGTRFITNGDGHL
jgi:hypothetical protein